jgi:DNA-binding LacI/PurR family transcriptional regulator
MLQYLQVYRETKNKILQGDLKPGSKLPAHREMCEDYSVSINTITKAINRLKKEGYVESFRGLGTVVAQPPEQAGQSLSHTISLVTYHQHFMQDAFSYTVQKVFSGSNWSIHSRCSHSNLEWYRDMLADCRKNPPAGMILLTMHPTWFQYGEELLPKPCTKVVLIDHEIPGQRYDLVRSNACAVGRMVAEFLVKKGYRDFVFFSDAKPKEFQSSLSLKGMGEVFARFGISFGPEHYWSFDNPHSFGPHLAPFEDSYNFIRERLRRERPPRVIIAGHDWCAVGAIRAILDSGLSIPDDVAVMSSGTAFDLSAIAGTPKITSVDLFFNDQIRSAAEVLKARLEGDDGPIVYREFSGQILEGETA